jgi:xanthine/CO dehydrogenase XdhC/CoxF family maturation factor
VAYGARGEAAVRVGDRWLFDADGRIVGSPRDGAFTAALADEARAALAERRSRVRSLASAVGTIDVLVEHIAPRVALLAFGAGADAVPLVGMAAGLGWDVTVADPRPAFVRADRFPEARRVVLLDVDRIEASLPAIDSRTPCIVLTHNFLTDCRILRYLLASPAPYIGLLGPRKRAENLLREIAATGGEIDDAGRVHGPAGVDIGAETPEEIALSILAEVHARVEGRGAGFLRDRIGPLHDAHPGG